MDIQWPVAGSWAMAACAAIALVAWLIVNSRRDAEQREQARRRRRATYESRRTDWLVAIGKGQTMDAIEIKRQLDAMRKAGWHLVAMVVWSTLTGCRTPPPPAPAPIPLGTHILQPLPGDPVPALPDGEAVWWLCTPTGLRLLLPEDSPILQE